MLGIHRPPHPEESYRYHNLARADYEEPSHRRSSVVDISSLIESRDSLSPHGGSKTSNNVPPTPTSLGPAPLEPPLPALNGNVARSTFSHPPPPYGHHGEIPGGPVRSPPHLPPVSSIQLQRPGRPPPLPAAPMHFQAPQPYISAAQPYQSAYPPTPALPAYHSQSLPPLATAVLPPPPPPSLSLPGGDGGGGGAYQSQAAAVPPNSSLPSKRSAEGVPLSSPPPAKKHHGKWTEEEDNLAIELRRRGMKWDDIAKRIPGRSAISCRLRYQNYSEKRPNWDEEKKNKLARLYNRFKRDMWEMVATEMGLPWRAVEAMHWQMGQEEMASRANVPVFQPHPGGPGGPENTEESMHSPPPPMSHELQGPNAGYASLRRRSSSVSSRRGPPPLEIAPQSIAAKSHHAYSYSQPQNVVDRRYSTIPLGPLSDPGRPDPPRNSTLPPSSSVGGGGPSYPHHHSQSVPSLPPVVALANSPAPYAASETYGTPSPRTFHTRSTIDDRSVYGNGTPLHQRNGSQSSIRSTRSLAYGALPVGAVLGAVSAGPGGLKEREDGGPGSAPSSAVGGRRMSISSMTGPTGVRRNSLALPPPPR